MANQMGRKAVERRGKAAPSKKTRNETPKRKHTAGMLGVGSAAAILCAVLIFASFGLRERINDYDAVVRNLQEQIAQQQMESQELERESEYIKTEEYIEQIARDRLGLVKPNEIIFQKSEN